MSTDIDPSDPLNINMLLKANNSNSNNAPSEEEDSDSVGGVHDQDQPGDWSKFGSLWSPHHPSSFKSYTDFMDLSDFSTSVAMSMDTDLGIAMGMDYSYSSTLGIDPASLHFNPAAAGLGALALAHDVSTGFADSYGAVFNYQQQHQQQPLSTQGSASPESFTKDRRLSFTSSSSSSVSGESLSPIPRTYNALSSPPSGYTSDNVSTKDEPNSNSAADSDGANLNLYANSPAAELAHRVRQSAGLMLAVPVNGFGSNFQAGGNVSAGKLPIPRLNRPSTTIYPKSTITTTAPPSSSSASSAASTPPPSTPPSASHIPLNISTGSSVTSTSVPTPTPTTVALPRPKTSHTTIERRYRTNLNARIQSLRMAVPALRVLEDQGGANKKIKKNIKGGVIVKGGGIGIGTECSEDGSVVDVIDERGFVDGVKVARKCSKANVLGKAVEYIRVLKRRERRLKAELGGVKVLVEGLVGGSALIREWETQWRAQFGGEEKDEEEEGDGDGEDEDSDDEEGDEGDEEGAGRKRKRARVAPTSTGSGNSKKVDSKKKTASPLLPPVVGLAGEQHGNLVPEKRKRGRPRKVLPPPVTLEPVANASAPAFLPAVREESGLVKQDEVMRSPETASQWQQQQQSPPQRFLLAAFALFSFFNSPLTSSSMGRDHSSHSHQGKVLTPLHPPLVYSPEIVSQFIQTPPTAPTPVWKEYVQLFHLVVSFLVFASFVGNWFGFGISGFRFRFERRGWGLGLTSRKGRQEKKGNEDRIDIAEESALSGEAGSLSHFERLQIYRAVSTGKNVSLASLVSAAVALNSASGVFGGLARMKARTIWEDAKRKMQSKVNVKEEIVFGSMDVDEACERLADCVKRGDPDEMSDGEREYDLIEVLACGVVKERVRSHLGRMFVDFVGGREDEDETVEREEDKAEEERKRRKTVDVSRELGGSVEEMGRLFERVWKIGVGGVDIGEVESVFPNMHSAGIDEEIKSLFVALVLYARVFSIAASESSEETETENGFSSSSDTSKTKNAKMLELRKVLGCRVFEGCVGQECDSEGRKDETKVGGFVAGLEEARDRVVDLIVDLERRDR